MGKFTSAQEAAGLIRDESCIWLAAGGGGINEPSLFLKALEDHFLRTGHPNGLTVCHSAGVGDRNGGGVDRFAHEGMVRTVIGSHWTWSVNMQRLALEEKIEAYVLPQGTMTQLPREIAGNRPGVVTKIGLGTFVDPRVEGGALNRRSGRKPERLVRVVCLEGEEYLLYRSFPIHAAILRGSMADEDGNIGMEEEGMIPESLSAAQAAKNSGGLVIVQVKRVVRRGSLPPKSVKIPGILVDAVVVDPKQRQSAKTEYNPAFSGEMRLVSPGQERRGIKELSWERRIIARRAAAQLPPRAIVNLGFGMPDGVATVIKEEGREEQTVLTIEQGIIGGIPAGGTDFGMAANPAAILDQPYQFDWYDGGGLDVAVLSFAQFDQYGNVNVSRFGDRVNGVGGFINISQATATVLFVGTLTTGGLQVQGGCGKLEILREGRVKKAVSQVEQISFCGEFAKKRRQKVYYITERAVFRLTEKGVQLIEAAPGVDIERDILKNMDFRPVMVDIKTMESSLFCR